MLSLKLIRKNPSFVKKGLAKKQVDENLVDELLEEDKKRIKILQKVETLRAQRNIIAKKGGKVKSAIKEGKKIKKRLKDLEEKLAKTETKIKKIRYRMPNLPLEEVPIGKDESENRRLSKWGTIKKLSFNPQDHLQLGTNLNLIDVKRASKVSGSRFGYLKNEAVLLEFALIQYAFEKLREHDFIPLLPPVMITSKMMRGMGYLEHGGDKETYFLKDDDLYLVGTSEQSVGPMHANEVLPEKHLPLRYLAFSTCFRRESGSYGKDTRGIFRVHQFNKLEMFSFCQPRDSKIEHKFLLKLEEALVQALKIPYRLIQMCTGDLGHPAANKYDIECWLPSSELYRETHSVSNCTSYQARRLNIKYQEKGQTKLVHTLNGTYFSERLIIAIMENYQQSDGSIQIPQVLQKYLGKKVISPPRLHA